MTDEILTALKAWRDAREAIFKFSSPIMEEWMPYFDTLGHAEHKLMEIARKCK